MAVSRLENRTKIGQDKGPLKRQVGRSRMRSGAEKSTGGQEWISFLSSAFISAVCCGFVHILSLVYQLVSPSGAHAIPTPT